MWGLMAEESLLLFYCNDGIPVALVSLFDTRTVGLTYATWFFVANISIELVLSPITLNNTIPSRKSVHVPGGWANYYLKYYCHS